MGKLDPTMQDKWWRSVIAREEAVSHRDGTLENSKSPTTKESNLTVASLMRWSSHEEKQPETLKAKKSGSQHGSQASLIKFKGDKAETGSLASAAASAVKSHASYPRTPQLSQAGSNAEIVNRLARLEAALKAERLQREEAEEEMMNLLNKGTA
ncbi:hypothetical protein CEUSTIGMA_g10267.t1 [Chlamydomonas eustigma]|uniref:Uncharacterized protein n=1 Tax=Chlamydomonas eustigma TaxID=1157962 RepID=A0A250XID2_9CHLO|nr:hypothetical protein CEUSTIGMA_g10267.t1 [Chlamydomonas eustigma]|eukprot:GAX82841.1 hypothetical protein CEUSTIGMA_g10267.t1 [Chlamydomonas eustigma]